MSRNLLAYAIFALAGAIAYASTSKASASDAIPMSAVCEQYFNRNRPMADWMTKQIRQGRTHFIVSNPGSLSRETLCAW